ncbi:MAG: hypothetical protein AB1420_07000 [Bacillota bacterium]
MDTISHGLWAFLLFYRRPDVLKFVAGAVVADIPFIIAGLWLILLEASIPGQLPNVNDATPILWPFS